jgi:hypothetical protein
MIRSEEGFKEAIGGKNSESTYNGSFRGTSYKKGMHGLQKIYLECVYGNLVH